MLAIPLSKPRRSSRVGRNIGDAVPVIVAVDTRFPKRVVEIESVQCRARDVVLLHGPIRIPGHPDIAVCIRRSPQCVIDLPIPRKPRVDDGAGAAVLIQIPIHRIQLCVNSCRCCVTSSVVTDLIVADVLEDHRVGIDRFDVLNDLLHRCSSALCPTRVQADHRDAPACQLLLHGGILVILTSDPQGPKTGKRRIGARRRCVRNAQPYADQRNQ